MNQSVIICDQSKVSYFLSETSEGRNTLAVPSQQVRIKLYCQKAIGLFIKSRTERCY